jgi:hypothetical protein
MTSSQENLSQRKYLAQSQTKALFNRDIYMAVKVYITFSKGFYAHIEHWGVNTHTQSAVWGVNYAHPDNRGVFSNTHTQSAVWGVPHKYAHPKRSLGRHK